MTAVVLPPGQLTCKQPLVHGRQAAALFLAVGPDEFLVAGTGDAQITFSSDNRDASIVGIESIDEVFLRRGGQVPGRRMNGDESNQGQALRLHAGDLTQGKIYRVRLYRHH